MITNYSLLLIKSRWKIVMLNNLKTTAATVTLLIVFSLRCTIIYVRVIMRVLVGEDDALRHRDEESSVGRFNGNHRQWLHALPPLLHPLRLGRNVSFRRRLPRFRQSRPLQGKLPLPPPPPLTPHCCCVDVTCFFTFQNEPSVIRRSLTLGYNLVNVGQVENNSLGCVTVSVIFRPVTEVAIVGELNPMPIPVNTPLPLKP